MVCPGTFLLQDGLVVVGLHGHPNPRPPKIAGALARAKSRAATSSPESSEDCAGAFFGVESGGE